ncbi:LytR family transcriptional regulator [Streptomyces sp. TM32]|uniref:LCP family protein n=1 Tax=Streptomyces sp. TM32 TaxID=1652669 RepID=UPI001011F31E|nr:LCP family protein [Streptomyces sp. TM32]RXS73194.1 LytR family transcriptional regulator [Streptomyces sp. TM32]
MHHRRHASPGPAGTDATRTRRRRHRRARTRRLVLAFLALLLLAISFGGWYVYHDVFGRMGSSRALDGTAPRSTGGATNILLMGLDSRKDQNGEDLPPAVLDKLHAGSSDIGGYNTNTLILLHVPAGGGRATAFSIPRDDLVDIPGFPQDKIKKAYGLAKAHRESLLAGQGTSDHRALEQAGREAGRRATLTTVSRFLDVPIDHFAEVNLAGFYHLADSLGGVPVCLKHPVKDRYSGADFPAGRQTLDGARSLAFVRQRHGLPRGDLDRTRRQQAFLASALHKLDSAETFTDPARLLRLLDVAKQDVVIDEGWDLPAFLKQAKNLSGGNVEFSTLPIAGFAQHHGEDVNLVDRGTLRKLVRERMGPEADRKDDGTGADRDADKGADTGAEPTAGPPAAGRSAAPPSGATPRRETVEGGGVPCVD